MISTRLVHNNRTVTLSHGWILFIAWARSNNIEVNDIKQMEERGGREFLNYLREIVEIWEEEFLAYVDYNAESADELSSYLLSFVSDSRN